MSRRRYYECEILTSGSIKIGWQTVSASPDFEVGGDGNSWAFDGYLEEKVHLGMEENYGRAWHPGDVVGVFLDLADHTISKNNQSSRRFTKGELIPLQVFH